MPRSRGRQGALPATPLTQAKNLVRGAAEKGAALGDARALVAGDDTEALAIWAMQTMPRLAPVRGLVPSRLADLHHPEFLSPRPLEEELRWLASVLCSHVDTLQRALSHCEAFLASAIVGEPSQAKESLDRLEGECGYSLYAIASRFALLQIYEGTDEQKAYAASLRSLPRETGVRFYAHWWSNRADENTTPENYRSELNAKLQRWNVSENHRALLRYQLLGEWPVAGSEAELLSAATSTSVLDIYEMLVGLTIVAVMEQRSVADALLDVIAILDREIVDPRLKILLFVTGRRSSPDQIALLPPQLAEAEVGAAQAAAPFAFSFEAVRIAASKRWEAEDWSGPLWACLQPALRAAAGECLPAAEDLTSLSRLRLLFASSRLGHWLASFEAQVAEEAALTSPSVGMARLVHGGIASPSSARWVPNDVLSAYLALFDQETYSASLHTVQLALNRVSNFNGPVNVAPAYVTDARLEAAIRRGAFNSALILSREHQAACGEYNKLALTGEALALLYAGDKQQALELCARLIVQDRLYARWVPFNQIMADIPRRGIRAIAKSIYIPLFFSFNVRYRAAKTQSYISYAIEDLVESLGHERPSDVHAAGKLVSDEPALVAFFSEACALSVLRLSTAYVNDRELEAERIRICRILSVIDSDNSEAHEQEARHLVRGRIVRDALMELDRSKIAVDEEALRTWARRHLLPDYNRYLSLLSSGFAVADKGFREALYAAISQGSAEIPELTVPENEASALFASIVERFLHECALNNEHGLDCYLSVRIRHGTVSGLLRGPAEKEQIVTRTAVGSDYYKSNDHWLGRVREELRSGAIADLDDALRAFSSRLDSLARDLIDNYIQVRRDDSSKGLFALRLASQSVYALASEIDPGTSFEHFLDRVFDYFWVLVDDSLTQMRKHLEVHFKRLVASAYTNLENKVERIGRTEQMRFLADAIRRSRSETLASVDQMQVWFTMPRPPESRAFTLSELVDVSLATAKGFYPDFQPQLTLELDDSYALKGLLRAFSDIFFILFSNMYFHAGASPAVMIKARVQGDQLLVSVENDIPSGGNIPELRCRIEAASQKIKSGAYKAALPKQGGTGFLKLAKIIDLKEGDPTFEIGIDETGKAYTRFSIRVIITNAVEER